MVKVLMDEEKPDILILQETKTVDASFPNDAFPDHNCYIYGQPQYNGVAILVKKELIVTLCEPIKLNQEQARCIRVGIGDIFVYSVYVPCGEGAPSVQEYKAEFLSSLIYHLKEYRDKKMIIAGDFNVALTDADVEFPSKFANSPLCLPRFRNLMNELIASVNLIDTKLNNKDYTWWHYFGYKQYRRGLINEMQSGGVRIDYIFCSKNLYDQFYGSILNFSSESRSVSQLPYSVSLKKYRDMEISDFIKGKEIIVKPSDHAPLAICLPHIFAEN